MFEFEPGDDSPEFLLTKTNLFLKSFHSKQCILAMCISRITS